MNPCFFFVFWTYYRLPGNNPRGGQFLDYFRIEDYSGTIAAEQFETEMYASFMRESEDFEASADARQRGPKWRNVSAVAIGTFAAVLTLGLYNFGRLLAGTTGQYVAVVAFPGLLGSMAVAGNAHAFSLWVAAALNGLFYGGLTWAALSLASTIGRKFR